MVLSTKKGLFYAYVNDVVDGDDYVVCNIAFVI